MITTMIAIVIATATATKASTDTVVETALATVLVITTELQRLEEKKAMVLPLVVAQKSTVIVIMAAISILTAM